MWVLQTEGEANALKFSQFFHLAPSGGSFTVTNGEKEFLKSKEKVSMNLKGPYASISFTLQLDELYFATQCTIDAKA